jgi:hypothetical protein
MNLSKVEWMAVASFALIVAAWLMYLLGWVSIMELLALALTSGVFGLLALRSR